MTPHAPGRKYTPFSNLYSYQTSPQIQHTSDASRRQCVRHAAAVAAAARAGERVVGREEGGPAEPRVLARQHVHQHVPERGVRAEEGERLRANASTQDAAAAE